MKPWYLRLFLWCFCGLFYRVRAIQPERLPSTGGALVVSNHLSFVDLLLILYRSKRFIRFMISEEVCSLRLLRWPLRRLGVIPLPPESRKAQLTEALKRAADAIRGGEVVGIFAERNISRIGVMLPFRREFERIMEGLEAPVIPVCLDGVWGSIFSFRAGRFFWKLPRSFPYPVTVSFGEALPARATASQVRAAIKELNTEAWQHRRPYMRTIGRAFVRKARHHPFRFAMADALVAKLTLGKALMGAIFLGRRLRPEWEGQEMVGICLPPSVGGALVNLAALLAGKVLVNLNYTLSTETLASCASQCDLQTVVSSRLFLDRLKVTLPGRVLFLEDLRARPRWSEKLAALALAWLAPVRLVERSLGAGRRPELDDLAAVMFSSGSTGQPKGIMLSHFNITSNIDQIGQTFDFGAHHRFAGVLPFFHSFGFTATLVQPAVIGFGVVYQANPLDGKAVGELVRRYGATTLMATPRLLEIYLRACEPADLGSVTFVMTGAERLPGWVAAEFQKKFGLLPVEGYGCTECSPVVGANRMDFRTQGLRQVGTRPGTIGPPLPGVSVRLVDPETRVAVPDGQPGLLLVRGPNVMRGYLRQPDKTAAVLRDGWYETGDIALLDEDGFLKITDRLSRFSKIGGEMVPHGRVEEALQALAGVRETTFVVTGVEDEKKGERLAVLHKLAEPELAALWKRLPEMALPNLWVPKPAQFFRVTEFPMQGIKLDLKKCRELAARLTREAGEAKKEPSPA